MHWTSFHGMTFEQLEPYKATCHVARGPSHLRIQHEGIEVTNGPLGQNDANTVGFAMATKRLVAYLTDLDSSYFTISG